MLELKQRRVLRGRFYSIPSIAVLLLLAILLVRGAVKIVDKERESTRLKEELEAKALSMTDRKGELEANIASLHTEEGIKNEIREKFSVTEEGESVALIVDDRRATSTADESS